VRRRDLLGLLIGAAAAAPPVATRAQQQRRIGFLSSVSADGVRSSLADFLRGLNDTGYNEGRNLLIEYRWADGDFARLPALAADLVRSNVDVIVTAGGPQPTRGAAGDRGDPDHRDECRLPRQALQSTGPQSDRGQHCHQRVDIEAAANSCRTCSRRGDRGSDEPSQFDI
jgi:hypothetical protein